MSTETYRPATRWCHPHPYTRSPAGSAAPGPARRRAPARDTPEALLQLLAADLQHGRWRLAIRRFLMLEAFGRDVPPVQRARCKEYLDRCSPRDLQKIATSVRAWAALVRLV